MAAFLFSALAITSADACVTYRPGSDTYTVDSSGCVLPQKKQSGKSSLKKVKDRAARKKAETKYHK